MDILDLKAAFRAQQQQLLSHIESLQQPRTSGGEQQLGSEQPATANR